MKFNFYPLESRLYDFIHFPALVFAKAHHESSESIYRNKDIPMEGYLDFINMAEEKLRPYIKDIEVFYSEKYLNSFDFIELISDVYTIFGHEDESAYLNMLRTLNEDQIISAIAYSILAGLEERKDFSKDLLRKAESLTGSELVSLIKDLPIEPGSKWNLFLIIQEPGRYMKIYVNLMYDLLPVFQEIYSLYREEVKICGHHLSAFLNERPEGLKEISNSIIDRDIIRDEDNALLISAVEQYEILISGASRVNYMVWGLKTEEYFKKLKALNENKLNERVQIFKNLGDKTRYEVLKLLAGGQTSTKEIANALGVSSATISYHLSNLMQAKVIKPGLARDRYNYIINYSFLEEIINDFKKDILFPDAENKID